ncbi:FitA-like ribbon-helix-helix domain-containing protein [Rhizobium sp.]
MASMTIRNLDDGLKARLRIRAAEHGRSMEEEARDILRVALMSSEPRPVHILETIRRRVEAVGGIDIELPPRSPIREPIDFSE